MTIGERIRMARVGAKMSLREMGDHLGISHTAVSKYEKGELIPSSDILVGISQATNYGIDYFFRSSEVMLSEPAFRARKALAKKEKDAILIRIEEWLERYLEIEDLMDCTHRVDIPDPSTCRVSSFQDVEEVAKKVREMWDLGTDPIENVMDVLERHGIRAGFVEASQKFDAMTIMCNEDIPVIVVNSSTTGDRQRFNLAHELGHMVLNCEGGLNEEAAANRFAGAFLVPSEMAYSELGNRRTRLELNELYLLKHKYGMSMAAWIYRACDLGIIDEPAKIRHFRIFSQRGWRKMEPGEQVPSEQPTHMKLLVLRALGERRITRSRAEELLDSPINDLGVFA